MSLADQISLRPTAGEVRRLNEWLDKRFAVGGVKPSIAADLKLCLNEVLANLISYGLDGVEDPQTDVEILLFPGRAGAVVTDNGAPFDVRKWDPPRNRDLRTAEPGGFGIALLKERASYVAYTRRGNFNRLEIVCEGPSR